MTERTDMYFSGKIDKKVQRNRNMEIEMDDALKNGEFIAYLQPKVNMISTKLTGAEALSRWNHPDDGIRTPGVYISLFEKNLILYLSLICICLRKSVV